MYHAIIYLHVLLSFIFCCKINYLLLLAENGKNEISAQSQNTRPASKYAPSLKICTHPQKNAQPQKNAHLEKAPILNSQDT